jgi:hypothetical protein
MRDIEAAAGADTPCQVCGQWPDSCICPECPSCGEQGNPRCYEDCGCGQVHNWTCTHHTMLVRNEAQILGSKLLDEAIAAEVAAEQAYFEALAKRGEES